MRASDFQAQMELAIKLESIFTPVSRRQRDHFYKRDPATGVVIDSARFVHYTSAEAALGIISDKRMWMRNAMSMSDFREVQHGFDILQRFFSDKSNLDAFTATLDACSPGAATEAIDLFHQQWGMIRFHTYIASMSEHLAEEDQHGRLSMWRAFGAHNPARVALVFKVPWSSGPAILLNLLFSPVAYLSEEQAHQTMHEVLSNVTANRAFLTSIGRAVIVDSVLKMLVVGTTCVKHEGFQEEREWRAIYSPYRRPSNLMERSTRIVSGIPQVVYSIPLDETASPALAELELSQIFDSLIIGPSPDSLPMYEAFLDALTLAGISSESAQHKIRISGIPVRG